MNSQTERKDKKHFSFHPKHKYISNSFHILTDQEREDLQADIEENQFGPDNINGGYIADDQKDELKKGQWRFISKLQEEAQTEESNSPEFDKYGLRNFWETKRKPKRKVGLTQEQIDNF